MRDESAYLVRGNEDHVGAVTQHSGGPDGRGALLRTIVADVRLEAGATAIDGLAGFVADSMSKIGAEMHSKLFGVNL